MAPGAVLKLEGASGAGGHNGLGAGLSDGFHFLVKERQARFRMLDTKRSPLATTFFRHIHFHESKPRNRVQDLSWRFVYALVPS